MKLFLKILLFIFTMLITTVGETQSSAVINVLQKETSNLFFQESQLDSVISETHFENSCLNGEKVIAYGELLVSIAGSATNSVVHNPEFLTP